MAVDKKVIDYVKNQLNAGYTPDQIKAALAKSGYTQADIKQAMSSGGAAKSKPSVAAKAKKPAKKAKAEKPTKSKGGKPIVGFAVSLIGGIFILLAAILPMVGITVFDTIFSFFPVIINFVGMASIIGIILGIVTIIGAALLKVTGNIVSGAIVVVVTIIALLSGSGFFLGSLLGIIGGAIGIAGK